MNTNLLVRVLLILAAAPFIPVGFVARVIAFGLSIGWQEFDRPWPRRKQ